MAAWLQVRYIRLFTASGSMQVALAYFRIFLVTMQREWMRIDKLRLDKFMLLARCFVKQTFESMLQHGWCASALVLLSTSQSGHRPTALQIVYSDW